MYRFLKPEKEFAVSRKEQISSELFVFLRMHQSKEAARLEQNEKGDKEK